MNINERLKQLTKGKEFRYDQMEQIKQGLEDGLSIGQVKIYADEKFDWQQMAEIRKGLEKGLNVSIYANEKFDFAKMEVLRKILENKKDKKFINTMKQVLEV